jgi:hypothetical protein
VASIFSRSGKNRLLAGQGATEYLVLLAVVLIIALVSIALLGFFPGMADDARVSQSKSYWLAATPIAVIDGAGVEGNPSGSYTPSTPNFVMMTLRNTAAYPVELIGMSGYRFRTGYYRNPGYYAASFGIPSGVNPSSTGGGFISFTPRDQSSYRLYIAPPKGTGITDYSSPIILAPGEEITVGYPVTAYAKSYGGYPARTCSSLGRYNDARSTSKYIELPNFNIWYSSSVEGYAVVKKQVGSKPMVLPCTTFESSPWAS